MTVMVLAFVAAAAGARSTAPTLHRPPPSPTVGASGASTTLQEHTEPRWQRQLRAVASAAPMWLSQPIVRLWRLLPGKLPSWWRASGLTSDALGQVAFMASNVAYLGAGARLLSTPEAPRSLGVLMLVVCAASCGYHAAQCVHGCGSEPASRACTLDSVLAVGTAFFFMTQVHIDLANVLLAGLSLAFFKDLFRLGYTVSHSMWHFSTAAAAVVSRPKWLRNTAPTGRDLGRLRWLSRAWAVKKAVKKRGHA